MLPSIRKRPAALAQNTKKPLSCDSCTKKPGLQQPVATSQRATVVAAAPVISPACSYAAVCLQLSSQRLQQPWQYMIARLEVAWRHRRCDWCAVGE